MRVRFWREATSSRVSFTVLASATPSSVLPASGWRCKATWKRESRLQWHEAGSSNHHDDMMDSDQ